MINKTAPNILLASASSRRFDILRQVSIFPDLVLAADIDETPIKGEKPKNLAIRLSQAKAEAFRHSHPEHFILAADTVVACGQKILEKAKNAEEARQFLEKLSGRRHQVHGGMTLITPDGRTLTRHCLTLVQFKPLSATEIDSYIESGEWEGKAGAYAIQGFAGAFIKYIRGSYSNVVGLSLYDTMKILGNGGYNALHKKNG